MIAIEIGPIKIYRYGLFYLVGFIVGYFFLKYIGRTKLFHKYPNLQKVLDKDLEDLLMFIGLGVIIGGRLGQVFIYDLKYYITNPTEIIAIRRGGMSFIGGMLGVTLGLWIFKRIKKLSNNEFRLLIDCVLAIAPFGIMLGRIGNFLNQELYGRLVALDFRNLPDNIVNLLKSTHIFHIYPEVGPEYRVNTNFLASFFEGFINFMITLLFTLRRIRLFKYKPGFISGLFLVRYSFVRFMLEYLRQDSQSEILLILSRSQRIFTGFFVLGMWLLLRRNTQQKI